MDDRVKRALDELLRQKQEEILRLPRDIIEQQYCAVHGRFAELQDVEGAVSLDGQATLRFSTCCDNLRSKVQAALHERAREHD